MKQALTEALARYDEGIDYVDPEGDVLVAAARLVERLLPGECGSCNGVGLIPGQLVGSPDPWIPCEPCHSNGQVWDEGIVEAVAKAIRAGSWSDSSEANNAIVKQRARAVLSALVELLTEKAGSQ